MPLPLSFLSGVLLFNLSQYFPFSSLFFFAAIAIFLLSRRKIFLISVVVAGIFYAFLRLSPGDDGFHAGNRELKVTGRFVPGISSPETGKAVQRFEVDEIFVEGAEDDSEVFHDERIGIFSEIEPDYDETYELLLKTGIDRTRFNPGGIKKAGLSGTVLSYSIMEDAPAGPSLFFERQRNALNRFVLKNFSPDSAGLVSAITTGERAYLGEGMQDAFNATGLAHILSISGTHFGLFSVMLFGFFVFLIKRLPYSILHRLTLYMSPAQASAILSMPFMVMYLGLSGASVPAVRSFVMITLFLAGLLIGRKGFWLRSLLFAALVLVIWDPGVLLSLSFQLSFAAVLIIGFSVEKTDESGETGIRVLRYIKSMTMIAVAASIGTAPLVAYHFHYFSVLSPFSNLIVTPVIGFVLIPLSLVSSFVFLATGQYILGPLVKASADISVALVRLMADIPFASVPVPAFPLFMVVFFYAALLLYPLLGRSKKILLVPFIPFVLYAIVNGFERKEMSVTFLDVGQGDSAVAELSDGKTIVIDTGRTGRETAEFLRYIGKREVDAVILSHVHPDHSGGFRHLVERFNVKEVWDNGRIMYPEDLKLNGRHRPLERGDSAEQGSSSITVLHPYREFYSLFGYEYDEENNSSLVLKLSSGKTSFLFTGDIEDEAEDDIAHLGPWLKSEIIKVPHHGSRTSLNELFLSEVSPAIAVISAGRDNAFGHPSPEVLERLQGVRVLRTDLDGAIKIIVTPTGHMVKTFRDHEMTRVQNISDEAGNIRKLFVTW